jgi:rRNA-processing protein FCF1
MVTKKRSRQLVVDASVVRSAGETEHPVSSACRHCLNDILEICHRVVVTDPIDDEWKRHGSRFFRKWRVSMNARKKMINNVEPDPVPIDSEDVENNRWPEIQKDLCLLEAALAADKIVVTRDDSIRQLLSNSKQGEKLAKTIRWINPVTQAISDL